MTYMWEFYLSPPHKQHPKLESCTTSFMPRDLVQTLSFAGWVPLLEREQQSRRNETLQTGGAAPPWCASEVLVWLGSDYLLYTSLI